jgi:Spy/CpxP family protein refolding chaperone
MMRLFQIRMQNRAAIDSLTNQWIAGRLELSDEQKQKLENISKEAAAKQSELRASMRDAGDDQRSEINQKLRDLRTETDSQATGVLTSEQKESFESMKGEKLELPRRGRQRQAT